METIIKYYNDGTVSEAYVVDDNGKKQGAYEKYSASGELRLKCTYKDDKKHGPCEWHDEDGQTGKCSYKKDEYDGLYEQYDKDGKLQVRCFYKEGNLHGPYEKYYDNGKLEKRIMYKDGQREGLNEWYHKNGQLETRCTYKDGKYDGLYESYYADGQLEKRCTYKDGTRDGPFEFYCQSREVGYYINGEFIDDDDIAEDRRKLNEKLHQMSRRGNMFGSPFHRAAQAEKVKEFRAKYSDPGAGRRTVRKKKGGNDSR